MDMTPAKFIAKWRNVSFGERQAAQEMFLDLCRLVGHPTPGEYGDKEAFTFEKWVPGGFADAYLEGRFGWEFKGDDAQLGAALNQLLRYSVHLKTPPLLIVSSFRTIRIQTNFPGMETVRYGIALTELAQPENLRLLRSVFFAPADLRPTRSVEDVTKETANLFRDIVSDMEDHDRDPEKLARYLNQMVFCLYAEDAGLLPKGLFTQIVRQQYRKPDLFNRAVADLFREMSRGGLFGANEISHFNGDLFDSSETIELSSVALQRLAEATGKNWQNIEPSIFGVLFERALDASKRSQLGAHYTGAEDIMLVVEPVVMAPLRQEWETARREIETLLNDDDEAAALNRLKAFQARLSAVKVLDPACGSGNFLYLTLRSLLDLEKVVIDFGAARGWPDLSPTVKPNQMLGLEINYYAAELARTALWIGYIQWHQANGFSYNHSPILTSLDTIRQTDAILDWDDLGNPREPEWPAAEFIIGNPPFCGNKMMRNRLGDQAVDGIYSIYGDRLPNGSDLCCYWFEKTRAYIDVGKTKRAGLLGTQGIRGGANRFVLQRIKESGDIFMAYPDNPWILDGAVVHISMVGFDDGTETERMFAGGLCTGEVNADLTVGVDLTRTESLEENRGIAFQGFNRVGNFDVSPADAAIMLQLPNPHGKPNSDILKPYRNAKDLLDRARDVYTIDFGPKMSMSEAALYEAPFERVKAHVKPEREDSRSRRARERWWLYQLPGIYLRKSLVKVGRYLATGRVSKHRIFVWLDREIMPDNALVVFIREDDYFFGILHSRIHEVWARALGTQLREAESAFRYTPTTCFETFPFPKPTDAQREAVSEAAQELNQLRENWLNSPDIPAAELKQRTLTNLYNQRPAWLDDVHQRLDSAVATAYGWPNDLDDQAILERLLTLNLERAAEQ